MMTGTSIGEALRTLRRARRLSLEEVAKQSGYDFKASALGAYERGERLVSVRRLQQLAAIYGVRPDAVLAGATLDEIDLTKPERITTSGLVLDLGRFIDSNDPEARAIMQFANAIKALRSEPTYSVLVIRRSDELALAALIGCKPSQLNEYLAAPPHTWEPEATALTGSRSR
jgi:transcriptional regulator with XRE-family HTH domain